MEYKEAVNYLYSFINYERHLDQITYGEKKFYLERMNHLLNIMGNPHRFLKAFHIAGTKGKGSTSAMIFSVLKSKGYKVGLFISPHLQTIRERISTHDGLISKEEFVELIEDAKPYIEKAKEHPVYGPPTFFEVLTAIAFLYFYKKKLDFVVIEVGLGGRLDATNTIIPMVSIITPIGFDHMHILGNTLSEIAREKAGIIKEKVPLVCSPQDPSAWEVIKEVAINKKAPYFKVDDIYSWKKIASNLKEQIFVISGKEKEEIFSIPLLGAHQLVNAVCCYASLSLNLFWEISSEDLRRGFSSVSWPGRFEIVKNEPLVVLDGAHNISSAIALRETLEDYVKFERLFLICGMMKDKDSYSFLNTLEPLVYSFHFLPLPSSRTRNPEDLGENVKDRGKPIYFYKDFPSTFEDVYKRASPNDLILITGSLYLVGEARDYLLGKLD
ncbi:MAG: bifunctional folylpolyglutamate synthase/dihydrofolate synthase [Dictyoglomus sp.]|nr:bifunctional folylpolyglutamate synthase/dihydrofolate synthase [Dictyoglomus sp.]MCX7941469.1 bifunctional folylpolyglutamate synthase/dihydrofolate synthase [Dictyoglomaceae bacterium]MDW8188246.1 folylpolyglutamate synthase/dihydrofolate synthase family protein [Dictyoglomus sp.]